MQFWLINSIFPLLTSSWIFSSCIASIPLSIWWIYQRSALPRGYRRHKEIIPRKRKAINRNRYRPKKVPENLDAIIVGSGVGGLTAAGLLARIGWHVLVLEKHYIMGGCIHNFEDHGYEWDTGLHYLGDLEKRKELLDIITDKPIEWNQIGTKDDGTYDVVVYHNGRDEVNISEGYKFKAGKKKFIDTMSERFPDERKALEKYIELVENVAGKKVFFLLKVVRPKWLAKLIYFFVKFTFEKWARKSALEVIQELTENKTLQTVLTGQWGDYGLLPSKVSFLMHAGVVHHYLEGAWYPALGADDIVNKIVPIIEKSNGAVLTQATVDEILIDDNGKAYGVKVNGNEILAPCIVSNIGFLNTRDRLLPEKFVPKSWSKITRDNGSLDLKYLFIGLEGSPEELNLPSHNLWSYPHEDYDKYLEEYMKNPLEAPMFAFISFPCTRYRKEYWEEKYPNKSNCLVLTVSNYKWFERWKDQPQGKRDNEYEELKDKFKERMLEEFCRYYPNLKSRIVYSDVGTPLSFEHYIGTDTGAYGLEMGVWRFRSDISEVLRPNTEIPGLYLTGQDISTLGVFGAVVGGVLTAHSILGYGGIDDILTGRNLISDIKHQLQQCCDSV